MGKKMKKKGPNPRKALHRVPSGSPKSVLEPRDRKANLGDEGEKGGESCSHYSKSIDELNRILLRIRSSSDDIIACEHCREEPNNKRRNNEKGKQPKKKGGARSSEAKSESNIFWVCLDCSRYFCGGAVSVSEPYGHARRHLKQEHHHWAVRFDNPLVFWCYSCNSTIPIEMPEEVNSDPYLAMDSVEQGKGIGNGVEPLAWENMKGYTVRGLANLGNTCFFNSVMQNLLAMDMLRNYLVILDRPLGPLTMALRKLFVETSSMIDSKSILSPKSLFGCICVKAPQFRGYQEHDSHELLRYLLDGLHIEELSAGKSWDSSDEQDKVNSSPGITFVDAFFGGQLSSTVSCVECGHTSVVHEPFLDLSLSLPSKKPPPKKAPHPPPKRTKPPLRERNKGRRFREKGTARESPVTEDHKAEIADFPSECSESCVPALEQVQSAALKVEVDLTWMDFLDSGSSMIPDDGDLDSDKCEVPVAQCSDSEKICQSENNAQYTLESQPVNCSKELTVSSESCGESSCRNEVPSSCIQDSGVLLLPYKELDTTVEEINGKASFSQNSEDLASVDAPVNESSVAEAGQAEADFDGLGDLFNDPEVTSALKTENGVGEEMDIILWTGNSSESNQDEVDSTNSPVSINSCLALFTKPELLSDEQAWHCESCSKISQHQNVGRRKGKLQAVARVDQSETFKALVDGGQFRSKEPSPNFEVDSTKLKVQTNGKATSSSRNLVSHVERLDDPNAKEDISQKPPDLIGDSDSNGEIRNEGSINLLDTVLSDQARCPGLPLKDEDIMESDDTSLYLSCPSAHENTLTQENSGNQDSDSCSINDLKSVGCENDSIGEVNQVGKKGLRLLDKGHTVDSNGSEEVVPITRKVMRDATKRILINRAPPILTIHLKRFSQDVRGRLSKLRGHVSFQETLDLRPYIDPRCEDRDKCCYRLVGAVEHSGGMNGGHYVAYVRGRGRTQRGGGGGTAWFCASDAHVREVSLAEVLQSEAYILFYERVLT